MESFTLTRREISSLLLSLQGTHDQTPISILQRAWTEHHQQAYRTGGSLPAFLSTEVPHIIEKIIQGSKFNGFSLHEIADLGHLVEHSNLSITSIQNWVKRDFKDMFDSIKEGRKYSINQAALLYIIDDLKINLDFISIRKLFQALFFPQEPNHTSSEWIEPVQFYYTYTTMFEELDANHNQVSESAGQASVTASQDSLLESEVQSYADRITQNMPYITKSQQKVVNNVLVIAALSVQTSYLQAVTKRYYNATVFLDF
ncbi:DUF1836 domain-containing protein [Paenibacillus marinisediminis]